MVREVVEAGTNNSLGAWNGICFERHKVARSYRRSVMRFKRVSFLRTSMFIDRRRRGIY
jgi:hypothetical protein